jgi:hypothetical protein
MLLYGAFALFGLLRRWLSIDLAPVIVDLVQFYRTTVEAAFGVTLGAVGLRIPAVLQDLFVLWVALGRIVGRSFVLLFNESADPKLEYRWFHEPPFARLTSVVTSMASSGGWPLRFAGVACASFVVMMLWPIFVPVFLRHPTVHRREGWRVPIGGTPHPSNPREVELPPLGDELKPKFSAEVRTELYDARIVMRTYLGVQAGCILLLVVANATANVLFT